MNLKYYNYIQYNNKPITYFHSSNIIKYNFKCYTKYLSFSYEWITYLTNLHVKNYRNTEKYRSWFISIDILNFRLKTVDIRSLDGVGWLFYTVSWG